MLEGRGFSFSRYPDAVQTNFHGESTPLYVGHIHQSMENVFRYVHGINPQFAEGVQGAAVIGRIVDAIGFRVGHNMFSVVYKGERDSASGLIVEGLSLSRTRPITVETSGESYRLSRGMAFGNLIRVGYADEQDDLRLVAGRVSAHFFRRQQRHPLVRFEDSPAAVSVILKQFPFAA